MRKILITGGYGFIGSNLIRYWLRAHPADKIINVDALTYAARPDWVHELVWQEEFRDRFQSVIIDLCDSEKVRSLLNITRPDHIINLAAESHVCRSIETPAKFVRTNVVGTFNLIDAFMRLETDGTFYHVSTDEVYGEAHGNDKFHEELKYNPRSPYAASKAASDHLVMAYYHTYGVKAVISNCSNNFGPNQHEEKLIPKAILSLLQKKKMPVYQGGTQVRDWLYVLDHCKAIDAIFHKGIHGETYCVGGDMEMTNLHILDVISGRARIMTGCDPIEIVCTDDRPTDDKRYAIDCSKLKKLGWAPSGLKEFYLNIDKTIAWYKDRGLT